MSILFIKQIYRCIIKALISHLFNLFGAFKFTENDDPYKISYIGYDIAFDAQGNVSSSSGDGLGKNILISGDDNNSSVNTDNSW